MGMSPDEIVSQYSSINLSDVYAALAYFHDNLEEIRLQIEEDEKYVRELQAKTPAIRSPDVSWITKERVDRFTKEEKAKFLPLAPDFVLELMSPRDPLETTRTRMREYQENGVKLGWLINPQQQQVEIYHLGQSTEILNKPLTISGEDILTGLVIELNFIWE